MTREEAINVLNDYDINFERHTAEEIAEAHEIAIKAIRTIPSEDEKIIRIKKGTLKARIGRYVVYDVEWLKTHFNTTEAKIYGQPNEDCISRQAVDDAIYDYSRSCDANYQQIMEFIDKISSITPQPKEEPQQKTGHWEWVQYESKPNFGNWHCSECCCILCGAINGNPIRLPKYCPECGAKMQEVQQ